MPSRRIVSGAQHQHAGAGPDSAVLLRLAAQLFRTSTAGTMTMDQNQALWSELAHVSASAGSVEHRARGLLESLRRVVPYAAAWIALRDPETRRHEPVGTDGDTEPLARYFALPEADDEVEQLGLNRLRPPMRAGDLPMPLAETRAWGDYLLPAGFRDGFAMGLFTDDGRHLGFISLLTDDPAQRTAAYSGTVARLRPLLARALDRLPSLAAVARLTGDALGGAVLTSGGRALPLPGLPENPLLASGSTVVAVAREYLTAAGARTSFVSPSPGPGDGLVRIMVLDCRDQRPDHLSAVVLLRPVGDLQGLGRTDLEVLGALLHGWGAKRIGDRFPPPFVHARVERMAAQVEVPSSRHLLLHAARAGLYVPPALWRQPHS
jgi:hypothetical protein